MANSFTKELQCTALLPVLFEDKPKSEDDTFTLVVGFDGEFIPRRCNLHVNREKNSVISFFFLSSRLLLPLSILTGDVYLIQRVKN